MLMKEKMPVTPVTPVPTPSAAIAADARSEGPSTAEQEPSRLNAPRVHNINAMDAALGVNASAVSYTHLTLPTKA